MGHPLIPQAQIDVFWRSIEDGFTVAQAAKLAGLTYQQGRYVKAKLHAEGKRGNLYRFKYGKQKEAVLELIAQGITPYTAAKLVGVSPTVAYNWQTESLTPDPVADDTPRTRNDDRAVPARPTTERRPVDRREGLWSRPPRVSVPAPDRHRDDPWTVDWTDD
jgi:hypothetical protein